MASGLGKQAYFSYLSSGPGGKIRLLVHENSTGSEDCISPPKTFIGKVAKLPVSSSESPFDFKPGMAPPSKGTGETTQLVVGSKSAVGAISGLPLPTLTGGNTIPIVMVSKAPVDVKTAPPIVVVSQAPVDVKTAPPIVVVSQAPVDVKTAPPVVVVSQAPVDVKTGPPQPVKDVEKGPCSMAQLVGPSAVHKAPNPVRRGRPPSKGRGRGRGRGRKPRRGSQRSSDKHEHVMGYGGVIPYSVVSKTPIDSKSGKPSTLRGTEMVPLIVTSKTAVVKSGKSSKPGISSPLNGDEVFPFVMTSQPLDVKSGLVPSVKDVWKDKFAAESISKASTVGSSQSVFVPLHVISSSSQKPLPQIQLINTRVRHPNPQMQLVNTQVQKSPPQVQLLNSQAENSRSKTPLQGIHVQSSSPQIKLLSTQIQKPVTQTHLLTSQPPITASQRYIVGHSPHQILGQHVLTSSQSPLITAPSAVSSKKDDVTTVLKTSKNGDVTTVLKTVASPCIVGTSFHHPGVGLKPLLPKIITGRIKQVQIITQGVVDRTPDDIPVVDLKDDESRDNPEKKLKPYQCAECGFCCSSKKGLEQHEDNHLGEVNYICDQCGKEFSTKRSLEDHLKVHASEKKFECDVCHKKFDYRDNLIFHMRIHGELKAFSAKCPICQKKFGNKSMRDSHLKNHTVEELKLHKYANSEVVPPQKNDASFQCDVCSKSFPDKVTLENHKVVHIKFDRGPKMEVKKKVTLEGTKHPCEHCKKSFNSPLSLNSHLDICEKNKSNSVACAFCKKHYGVIKQSKDDGSPGMKFICEPCCTFLAQKSQVSGFTPRLENRFICNKCDRCFESETQLREHLKSHIGGKPVRCGVCNKNFPSLSALQVHRVSHHAQKRVTSRPLQENARKNYRARKTLPTKIISSVSEDTTGGKLKRRKKRKRIERSKARNRLERMQSEMKLQQKRMMEAEEEFEVPYKKARYQFDDENEGNTSSTEEGLYNGDEREVNGYEDDDDSDDFDSDPNLGVPVEEDDDDDDDDDFLEAGQSISHIDDDDDDDDDDKYYDDEEEDNEDEDLFSKESMENLEVTIKQEPADNEDSKDKVMENCTVFNALPSKVKTPAEAAWLIPDKEIKQEKLDDYDELDVQIKQEKESVEEVAIKEENMIEEENVFIKEETCIESILFPIKEEKMDESDVLIDDEYEFTPFGDPVKYEKPDV